MVDLNQKPTPFKSSFMTTGDRSDIVLSSKDNPFGVYNADLYNLEYRAKKKREHLEKLKIM